MSKRVSKKAPKAVPTLAPKPKIDDSKMDDDDKKQFCIRQVNSLGIDLRRDVLDYLVLNIPDASKKIQDCADCCRINLDLLDSSQLGGLFNLIKSKLES